MEKKQKINTILKPLMGEKNNEGGLKHTSCCPCKDKIQTKNVHGVNKFDIKGKHETTSKFINCNMYGSSKETKAHKSEKCPTKLTPPFKKKGCGLHLYLCVDKKSKKLPVKSNKQTKHRNKEKCKQEWLANPIKDNLDCQKPKITIVCDDFESLENSSSSTLGNKGFLVTSEAKKTSGSSHTTKVIFPLTEPANKLTLSTGTLKEDIPKGLTNSGKRINFDNAETLPFLSGHLVNICQLQKTNVSPNNCYNHTSNNKKKQITKTEMKDNMNQTKFDSFKEVPVFCNDNNPSVIMSNPNDRLKKSISLKLTLDDLEKEAFKENLNQNPLITTNNELHSKSPILKDYKTLVDAQATDLIVYSVKSYTNAQQKQKSVDSISNSGNISGYDRKKVSLMTSKDLRPTLTKNSLITLRKEKRQSVIDGRVSLILSKLSRIETKIADLEKITELKSKEKPNIHMGISCNTHNDMTETITADNNSLGDKQNELIISETMKPLDEKSNKTITIKSETENVFITSSGEVNVVKMKKQTDTSKIDHFKNKTALKSKQVNGESSHVSGKTKFIKCNNPRLFVTHQNNDEPYMNSQFRDKWRRVSEELKIDNSNCKVCPTQTTLKMF